ncbi:MAG: hypothetical protein LBP59_04690 [Planctomycetaceae bacterium]|nr:hypothetical protein [Planctomycetaceae bacterium]
MSVDIRRIGEMNWRDELARCFLVVVDNVRRYVKICGLLFGRMQEFLS